LRGSRNGQNRQGELGKILSTIALAVDPEE
jgi:hypothetical protein